MPLIWGRSKAISFCSDDWTGQITLNGFVKFVCARMRFFGNEWLAQSEFRQNLTDFACRANRHDAKTGVAFEFHLSA
jgi:hypothetical protein